MVHGGVAMSTRPVARRYDPPVPEDRVTEPRPFGVPVPDGTVATYGWGQHSANRGARRKGAPPPVVLLHGLNANARYWTGVASALSGGPTPGRRVLAPDLRGHGATGPLAGGLGLEDTRSDLRAWLDMLQLPRVDLVGHSFGGKAALDLAAAYPERVRRLVLVDPVPPQGLHPLFWLVRPLAAAIFAPERGPFADEAALQQAARRICWLRHAPPWMQRAFAANFRQDRRFAKNGEPGAALVHVLDARSFDYLYERVIPQLSPLPLDRVRMPVLLIRATYSAMPFDDQVRWLRARLPQLRTTRLAGEHSLHAVNPAGLARQLRSFLDP